MSSQSMVPPIKPKMSLVAQFDDLCRYTNMLTIGSTEEVFKSFVENQSNFILKWKDSEKEAMKLTEKHSSLLSKNKRLQTQIDHLKNLVQYAENERKRVEAEKNSLARQIALIKDVLLADGVMDNQTREKLGFLNSYKTDLKSKTGLDTIEENVGSMLSLSDIDRIDVDVDSERSSCFHVTHRPKDKRSNSEGGISQRKKKLGSEDEESSSDASDDIFPKKPTAVRSSSEPASNSFDTPQIKNHFHGLRRCNTGSFSKSTPISRYSAGSKLNRSHLFTVKTLFRPEKCYSCQSTIGFIKEALKCQDCRVICHPECKDQCPLPCLPVVNTPTKGTAGVIADYVSTTAPMIPPLIVYCVNEIESRGFKDIGLYRIPGSEREVKVLKEKFLNGRSIPSLNQVDVHALCGTIKEFLRSLKEPLITQSAWQQFASAASLHDYNQSLKAIFDIVVNLPQPNRDTLAFLILHLKSVSESPDCKMPVSSLAKMLGPTIVGYSEPEPADINMFKETDDQFKVMERLLLISSDLWKSLLNVDDDVFVTNGRKTPEAIAAPKSTRLGPLYASGKKTQKNAYKMPNIARKSIFNQSTRHSSSPRAK